MRFTGVKDKIFPAGSDPYASKTNDDGCLIKDKVTKEQEIVDGFSNTLMIVECASRPDTYKASNGKTATGHTNQCIGWADSLGPFKLHGLMLMGINVRTVLVMYHSMLLMMVKHIVCTPA